MLLHNRLNYTSVKKKKDFKGYRIPSIEKSYDSQNKLWRIIAELPGVKKGEIDLAIANNYLDLKTSSKNHKYKHRVEFDTEIEPDSVKAKFNNGILDILVKTKDLPLPETKKVIIE